VKIKTVTNNNHRKEFSVITEKEEVFQYPYGKALPVPDANNRIAEIFVDGELADEAFTYVLESGGEGSIHLEQVLDYNRDPAYMADMLTYKLTLAALEGIEKTDLSRRQIARQLKTSVPQLYRLLDTANTNKSVSQLITLLHVLGCQVDFIVREREVA
jgi:hypothetical protein